MNVNTMKADSIVHAFHKNGELFYQVPYINGKQNGWYEQYHENGAIWIKELRIDGRTVDGYNIAYHKNGRVYQVGYFKDGHEVGKWYCYSLEGEIDTMYIYNRKGYWVKQKVWDGNRKKWIKTGLY